MAVNPFLMMAWRRPPVFTKLNGLRFQRRRARRNA